MSVSKVESVPILKLLVIRVGQVKSLGKTIWIGMLTFLNKFPSPICIFWTSVASLLKSRSPGVVPQVSSLTSCSSTLLIIASHFSIENSPVIGSVSRKTELSNCPVILKLGIMSGRRALKLFGVISNFTGCFTKGGAPIGSASYSIENSINSIRSFDSSGRLIQHFKQYWLSWNKY